MEARSWQIGVVGTFDVENYGDLLFPLLAEAELRGRLGPLELHRFSYHARTPPDWPYPVASVAELPDRIAGLDALLVGGGFLLRFDKEVAPGYEPPPGIHHPTGYWLTPALLAAERGIPLIWNAPGMHCNAVPAWAGPLLEIAFAHSSYIAVRDEPTRRALAPFAPESGAGITVVPDTGFGIGRLLELAGAPLAAELARLRADCGLTGKYIVVQSAVGLEPFLRFARRYAGRLQDYRFLALPIGPVLGDRPSLLEGQLPGFVQLPSWPHPLLLAALLGGAEAVVGHSYHLAITALAAGVPVFTPQDLTRGKYSALAVFDRIHPLPSGEEPEADGFLARLGKAAPSPVLEAQLGPLARHWDRAAAAVAAGPAPKPALGRFWQALPELLEDTAASRLLGLARSELTARDRQVAAFTQSTSWKLTSPLRFVGRRLRGNNGHGHGNGRRTLIHWNQLTQHALKTDPYRWAMIDGLYSPEDAEALAKTYPLDHFKLLSNRGGEKDYEYEARSLVGMGAQVPSYPEELSPAWRALAEDLVSPAYRNAMSLLTGCDLTDSPLEVNVFHYGPGCSLGPHPDLSDKIVTHVLYFNQSWNRGDGGCLSILRSADAADVAAEVPPLVGNSAVIVRSDNSWHAVAPVVRDSPVSRRSVTVTFYRPGSQSSMWPPDDPTPLHRYGESGAPVASGGSAKANGRGWWSRLTGKG